LNDVIDLWKLVSIFRDIGVKRENGTVSIVGRKKDMIVRGGENIYPTEVEQFLFRHPMVEDVQVKLLCR
jgi:acyl-CoA synthetase (AMP-forming)/AMP-acid ligase II